MSFDKCIQDALEAKKITGKKAQEAVRLYEGTVDELIKQGMSGVEARTAAAKQVTDHIVWEKAEQKRRTLKQIQKQAEIQQNLDKYVEEFGLDEVGEAGKSFFEWDGRAKYSNYVTRHDNRRRQLFTKMDSVLQKFEPKFAGTIRPKAGMENMIREGHNEATGDVYAKELYQAWSEARELGRKLFVRAGGSMPKREDYRFPQHQDPVKVRKATKDVYVRDHMDWMDWDAMRHPETGRQILPEERQKVLEYVFDTKASEGWLRARPGAAQRKALGNKLDMHRFLIFKDADSYLAMHKKYGDGSLFDAMVGHIERMSQDIAIMEVFGPNPHSAVENLKAMIKQKAGEKPEIIHKVDKALKVIDTHYNLMMRNNLASEGSALANWFGATTDVLTSSLLGSTAPLAFATDAYTSRLTKSFNKMPGTNSMKQYLDLVTSGETKQFARQSGLIAENATTQAFAQVRYMGDVMSPRLTRRIPDVVLRATGLSPHTQYARQAAGLEFYAMFARDAGTDFDNLPWREMLERHGINAEDWDVLRATEQAEHKGANFLRPDDLFERTDLPDDRKTEVADKFMEMVLKEREFMVPTATLRAKSILGKDTAPDTWKGVLLGSFAQYKNFPVSINLLHGRRGLQQATLTDKAKYLSSFAVGMTVTGAMALQFLEVARGRDPMDMTDPKFWGKAMLKGGGLGIWGDFLFSGINRFGGGVTETAVGPAISFAGETVNLTLGNIIQLINGEETKFPAELTNYLRRYTPGSNIWYLRAALQNAFWDEVQKQADPKAYQKFQREANRLRRETGQSMWWRPGQSTPDRAPDLGEAAGD